MSEEHGGLSAPKIKVSTTYYFETPVHFYVPKAALDPKYDPRMDPAADLALKKMMGDAAIIAAFKSAMRKKKLDVDSMAGLEGWIINFNRVNGVVQARISMTRRKEA